MFLRALLFLNQRMLPSLRTNIVPVPGSISSPENVQTLRSGMIITVRLVYGLLFPYLEALGCRPFEQVQSRFV